jgi:hypothetical protein
MDSGVAGMTMDYNSEQVASAAIICLLRVAQAKGKMT